MDATLSYSISNFILLLKRFVSKEIEFKSFEMQYWNFYENMPEEQTPAGMEGIFDEIYEVMYMSTSDPVTNEENKYGLIGHDEIRERISVNLKLLH